jgi:hypothetical protein
VRKTRQVGAPDEGEKAKLLGTENPVAQLYLFCEKQRSEEQEGIEKVETTFS